MSKVKFVVDFVSEYLQTMENSFLKTFSSGGVLSNEIASYVLISKGKRLRPILVFLFGMFGEVSKEHYLLAEAVELVHNATLIHDDIVDDADIRHSKPSVHFVWGYKNAVLAGDFLLAHALERLQQIKNPCILHIFVNSLQEICKGEMDEFSSEKTTIDSYLKRIYRKTALLFAISSKCSLILNNKPENIVNAGFQYGKNLGMAFQIIDDMLPYLSNSLNKSLEVDFLNKIDTLPIILAKEEGLSVFESVSFEEQKKIIKDFNILDKCMDFALEYINNAKENLKIFEDIPSKEALISLLDGVLDTEGL